MTETRNNFPEILKTGIPINKNAMNFYLKYNVYQTLRL